MKSEIIFQNDEVLAVAKPSGQAVIAGRGISEEPLNRVLEREMGARIFVVHRLDRLASGVVVFAKTAEAHRRLCAVFEARQAKKTYLAAVKGKLSGAGQIDKPLREFGSGRMGVSVSGKPSLTRYRVRETFSDAALVEVDLVTGRRHQIRAHLYSIGHPILGDPLYGAAASAERAPRLMLHHLELDIAGLPVLRCEVPEDFSSALKSLSRQA